MSTKSYTWSYRADVPPYEKLISVLEAFFASFPGGDYNCEHRELYKLQFRRGAWRKSWLGFGQIIPDRLVKGNFAQWPVIVRVLVRPSPTAFSIAIHYELHLPSEILSLADTVQQSVDQHIRQELSQLAAYLAECIGMPEPPSIEPQ